MTSTASTRLSRRNQAFTKVDLVPNNTPLEWSWSNGVLKTVIPQIGIHEVLVVRP